MNKLSDKQIDSTGKLQHLLTIEGIPADTIHNLFERTRDILYAKQHQHRELTSLQGYSIANIFFESSTRTRCSFELAASRLGAHVMNLNPAELALKKGETLADMLDNLAAMYCNAFVIRHGDHNLLRQLPQQLSSHSHILNAGSGTTAHPTQALLDGFTLMQHCDDLAALKVVIVGDIAHSRVANSQVCLLQKLGIGELHCVAPQALLPQQKVAGVHYSTDLAETLVGADVIMMLRIQFERIAEAIDLDIDDYIHRYRLDRETLSIASPNALIMHPGPINRDLEITSELINHERSCILHQVENGVAMRMAVLEHICQG